ncbi:MULTISPECIES: Npun_F0494 family protein [unclassified Thermosynechococcus]|uniref:Npun_F0494 family protein n=1 Tax=unclassified Thermosynechococcus TaxID=2622553 RepID=UPI0019825C2D|nr:MULTISPECIES: Npun_F0494 family protein [unclassified Thermosynechococcus]MDR7994217.1 hypothetical protein [Thermosynechococcus sp. TG252]QSF49949.1 hypothetical protein JW907_04120 [Thermosynechococcus sp. TA-1]
MAIAYSRKVLERGDRALRCSPFLPLLFQTMQQRSVALLEIVGEAGLQSGFTRSPLPALLAEAELDWLIRVGLLRREVDGQGLTDRYRLTPLGQQLIQRYRQPTWAASWGDRWRNQLSRWWGM